MEEISQQPALLLVCLGNICRSPLAEAAVRKHVAARGLDWQVDSAGTAAWHIGKAPDLRSQAVARQHGIDISGQKARQLVAADYRRFTHILVMDEDNLEVAQDRAPANGTAEVCLLLDILAPGAGKTVADPYYGGDDGFLTTWQLVDRAAKAWVDTLTDEAG